MNRASANPHWVRFRRLLGWMAALGSALACATLLFLRLSGPPMPWFARLMIGCGVFLTTMLTGALMGALFTSARGGYDADVSDPEREDPPRK